MDRFYFLFFLKILIETNILTKDRNCLFCFPIERYKSDNDINIVLILLGPKRMLKHDQLYKQEAHQQGRHRTRSIASKIIKIESILSINSEIFHLHRLV